MASSGKKVVPIFLTVLISVGTALYLGMLSYRPEVVDEKPQAVVKAAPPSSPRAAVAADQDAKRPARTLKIQPVAPPSSAQGNKPESEERDDRQGADESALNAPTQAHNEKPDDDEEDPSAQATAPGRNAPTEGTLDRATIKDGIDAVTPFVKACFEEGLKRDPSLAGRVVVALDIEAEEGEGRIVRGEVKEAETQSLFFEACVLQEVAKARFDAPKGSGKVSVTYPYLFDPGGGWGGDVPTESSDQGE